MKKTVNRQWWEESRYGLLARRNRYRSLFS